MQEKTAMIKLNDIVLDPTIQVRDIDPFTVSRYRQAMRAGAEFPPLLLEKGTNRIVCGNHRFTAYRGELKKPDAKVQCILRVFKDDAEVVRTAARDNARHGQPLSTWDIQRIIDRLDKYGDTPEQIAEILGIPAKKIKKLAGERVVVFGDKEKGSKKVTTWLAPVKRGLKHLTKAETRVPEKQYEEHAAKDRGISAATQAETITRWIKNGWIDTEDERTMENLRELHEVLGGFLGKVSKAA